MFDIVKLRTQFTANAIEHCQLDLNHASHGRRRIMVATRVLILQGRVFGFKTLRSQLSRARNFFF
jgi:hypothetical protein